MRKEERQYLWRIVEKHWLDWMMLISKTQREHTGGCLGCKSPTKAGDLFCFRGDCPFVWLLTQKEMLVEWITRETK